MSVWGGIAGGTRIKVDNMVLPAASGIPAGASRTCPIQKAPFFAEVRGRSMAEALQSAIHARQREEIE